MKPMIRNGLLMALSLMLALAPAALCTAERQPSSAKSPIVLKSSVSILDEQTPLSSQPGIVSGSYTLPDDPAQGARYGENGLADGEIPPQPHPDTEQTGEGGEQAVDGAPQGELGEQPLQYVQDLASFVPNTDYGLFWMDGGARANLDGATFRLGDAYTLCARFLIDAPVAANEVYSYWLPSALTGSAATPNQAFSVGDDLIATSHMNGNELQIVFTEVAQEMTGAGSVFELACAFDEVLNEVAVGDHNSIRAAVLTGYGPQIFTFEIAREAPADAQPTAEPDQVPDPMPEPETSETDDNGDGEPAPTPDVDPGAQPDAEPQGEPDQPHSAEGDEDADPSQADPVADDRAPNCGLEEGEAHAHTEDCYATQPEADSEADTRAPNCGLEEGDEHTHNEDCYATEDAAEAEQPAVQRSITMERYLPEVLLEGDTYTVKANLIGFENDQFTLRWQYDAGEGWVDYAAGDGLTELVVVSDGANVNYNWRVLVSISAPEDAAPADDGAATGEPAPADAGEAAAESGEGESVSA